jgi:hypothetical protein
VRTAWSARATNTISSADGTSSSCATRVPASHTTAQQNTRWIVGMRRAPTSCKTNPGNLLLQTWQTSLQAAV